MVRLNSKDLLEIGLHIAEEVSFYVKKLLSDKVQLHTHFDRVNSCGDKITLFDEKVNQRIIDIFKSTTKIHPLLIISEETGVEFMGSGCPEYFLILDPVDGSNNIRSFFTPAPNITMSLAIGYVSDLYEKLMADAITISLHKEIFRKWVFYGISGEGAYFSDGYSTIPIKVSPVRTLEEKCIIGIDLDNISEISQPLYSLISSHIIQRRLGSSHLDLCQVACGQYDAYISDSGRLKVTDVCQSYHLVKEAGGIYAFQILNKGKAAPEYSADFLTRIVNDHSLLKD